MMYEKLKKALGFTMAVGLTIFLLAGCASGGQNQSSKQNVEQEKSESAGQNQEGGNQKGAAPEASDERFNVSVMLQDFTGAPLSGEYGQQVLDMLEEYTDCNIEFAWTPSDGYADKVGVTLAQGEDMPMIMQVDMTANVLAAAKAGAFWDLSEFIPNGELPNLSRANEDVNKAFVVDGNLIGVYRARPLGRYGWGYRQDWADKLGLEEPKTIEDFYNMLYQFTYGDPDGNGKDDTYGLCLCKYMGPFDIMQTWFGVGNTWIEQDGNLVPVHQTEEYMEALTWFKKIYDDGLVYSDFAVRDTATWIDGMKNGECGVFVDVIGNSTAVWNYFVENEIPAVTGNGLASMHLMIGLAKDENSEMKSLATTGHGGCFVITKAAKTEEDVMNCLKFLDKINDNDMHVLIDYGLEGINWEEKGGCLVDLDVDNSELQKAYAGINQLGNILYEDSYFELPLNWTERKTWEAELVKEAEKYIVYNPAIGYQTNSETYAANGTTLDDILSVARTQYIVGQIDENGLQEAWDNWLRQGGSKVIEEVNAQYHAEEN